MFKFLPVVNYIDAADGLRQGYDNVPKKFAKTIIKYLAPIILVIHGKPLNN